MVPIYHIYYVLRCILLICYDILIYICPAVIPSSMCMDYLYVESLF